jgi:hypothetical protein
MHIKQQQQQYSRLHQQVVVQTIACFLNLMSRLVHGNTQHKPTLFCASGHQQDLAVFMDNNCIQQLLSDCSSPAAFQR